MLFRSTKYLSYSRTKSGRTGGSTNYKSEGELKALLDAGQVIEFWQAAVKEDASVTTTDGYVLDKRHANGNATVTATASLTDGTWTVEFTRPLAGYGNAGAIKAGTKYTMGVAIHDNHAEGRQHVVSMEQSFALDAGDVKFAVPKQ